MPAVQKIRPCLWFNTEAEEAANLYISLFDDAKITEISRYGEVGPMPAGTALMVAFELAGQQFQALNGGPMFQFTEAISLSVDCRTQEEVDHLWSSLTADGGEESQCGWLKDRFGLSWQIVPERLGELMSGPDAAAAQRTMEAMLQMRKLDIAALERAHAGG
ncbi:MAG: VOC family protein [Dehalococcoidia bacterium]